MDSAEGIMGLHLGVVHVYLSERRSLDRMLVIPASSCLAADMNA
jgi:hypothetical protein